MRQRAATGVGVAARTVSVVVCTHTDRRLALLLECVESLRANDPHEIIVVVDANPPLLEKLRAICERSGVAFIL